jgi:hypothetical protein
VVRGLGDDPKATAAAFQRAIEVGSRMPREAPPPLPHPMLARA